MKKKRNKEEKTEHTCYAVGYVAHRITSGEMNNRAATKTNQENEYMHRFMSLAYKT